MVQLNKDERLWVYFEMARVHNAHAVQKLCPDCWRKSSYHIYDTQELQKIQAVWY